LDEGGGEGVVCAFELCDAVFEIAEVINASLDGISVWIVRDCIGGANLENC